MEVDERNLSRQARRKIAMAAKRSAKKRQIKKKLFAKRMKTPAKLKASSEKAAKNLIVKKMLGGKNYSDLSIGQKELIDKKLSTKKGLIAKVGKKLLPKIKKKEKERLKKVRAKNQNIEELSEDKHGVLTLSVNDSQPEVSARYVTGKLKPYVFKTREDANVHCKKVGGKSFESTVTGQFYVEFTKLDGPTNEAIEYKNANEIKKHWKLEYPSAKFTFKKVRAKGNEFLMVLSPKGVELEKYQFVPKTGWTEMNENNETNADIKNLKAMFDIAQLLSSDSPYFKGRGSKKEYIKMLLHKIKKLSESHEQFLEIIKVPVKMEDTVLSGKFKNKKTEGKSKKKKPLSKMDAYKQVRKSTMPKSRPMQSKSTYSRNDLKKGKYD